MLESTRIESARLRTPTARSTLAYLIVRDQAHENAYAKALETLGVDWNKTLPIPKTSAEKFPEVEKLLNLGLQSKQYSFSLDNLSEAGRVFQGVSPSKDGTMLTASEQTPQGVPMTIAAERMEEFSPGLDTELLALLQATAELEMAEVSVSFGPVSPQGAAPAAGNDGTGLVDKVKNAIS